MDFNCRRFASVRAIAIVVIGINGETVPGQRCRENDGEDKAKLKKTPQQVP